MWGLVTRHSPNYLESLSVIRGLGGGSLRWRSAAGYGNPSTKKYATMSTFAMPVCGRLWKRVGRSTITVGSVCDGSPQPVTPTHSVPSRLVHTAQLPGRRHGGLLVPGHHHRHRTWSSCPDLALPCPKTKPICPRTTRRPVEAETPQSCRKPRSRGSKPCSREFQGRRREFAARRRKFTGCRRKFRG